MAYTEAINAVAYAEVGINDDEEIAANLIEVAKKTIDSVRKTIAKEGSFRVVSPPR